NELAAHREAIALVLDDYQVITSSTIHEGMSLLLERVPPCLHVIIAGRSDPPLGLALMRARGQLAEVRAEDLRFTPQEAAELLQAWGLACRGRARRRWPRAQRDGRPGS